MNRRPANALDSDDSESDWDTTVAESPTHPDPPRLSAPIAQVREEGDYATVLPKPRSSLKDPDGGSVQGHQSGKSPLATPRQDNSQLKGSSQAASPPPHMSSFQNALSDYSTVYETTPDIPPRGYESKGKLYTVPETDSFGSPQANTVNWDDSDAEERVLKEIQQNLERDKQRQQQQQGQAAGRDRKVTVVMGDRVNTSADNHGYMPSPVMSRSIESTAEKWTRANESTQGRSVQSGKAPEGRPKNLTITDISDPSLFKPPGRSGVTPSPVTTKSVVYYFEEGNPHFVEVEQDDVDAFLPAKVDDAEKLIRRVWREVFSVLRIVSSFFVIFLMELVQFLVHDIARPLLLDTVSTVGNYVVKPLLTLLFNDVVQPIFSFLWNIFSVLFRALDPIGKLLGYIMTQVAILVRAFRLVEIRSSPKGYRHELEVV